MPSWPRCPHLPERSNATTPRSYSERRSLHEWLFRYQAMFGTEMIAGDLGGDYAFVAKLSSEGDWLWAQGAGGSGGSAVGYAVATNAHGTISFAGSFSGVANLGHHTLPSSGRQDLFVARLDSAGNWLWASGDHSLGFLYGRATAIDPSGDVLLAGCSQNPVDFRSVSLPLVGHAGSAFVA